ncbi:MAG: hypothetical protein E7552_06130 [Ruminococcaceae bacterium]|nr:hypothetical protein [Oscillospiraceae bacterium]
MSTREKRPRLSAGLGVIAVQSVSCAVVVLAVLTVRLVSGNLFHQLADYFREAMRENTLTTAIHALWDEKLSFTESDV